MLNFNLFNMVFIALTFGAGEENGGACIPLSGESIYGLEGLFLCLYGE